MVNICLLQALNKSLLSYNLDEKEYQKAIKGQVCMCFKKKIHLLLREQIDA